MGTTLGCGPATRDLLARLATPVRNRYYYGKLLDAHHLDLEQAYGNRKRWLLNRLSLGSGVLCGLEVSSSADGRQVRVAPGVAIDGWGREIVVPADSRGVDPRQPTDECGRPDGDPIRGDATVSLWLCYHECPAEPAPSMASECPDERCEYGLVRERYRLRIRADAPPSPGIVMPEECKQIFADPGERTRRSVLCELLDDDCGPSEESCVPIAAIDLDANGGVAAIRSCGVRRTVYSNAVLLDLILCLAERVDACCTPSAVRSLQIVSGNNQTAPFGEPVPEPLVVRVIEAGVAIANEDVTFAVTAGGGAVGAAADALGDSFTVATEADGTATLPMWQLGASEPIQSVVAKIAAGAPSVVTFRAKPQRQEVRPPVITGIWPPNAAVLTGHTNDERERRWRERWLKQPRIQVTFDRKMNAARLADVRPWLRLTAVVRRDEEFAALIPLELVHDGPADEVLLEGIGGQTESFRIVETGDLRRIDAAFVIQVRAEGANIVDVNTPPRLLDAEFAGTTLSAAQLDMLWNLTAGSGVPLAIVSGLTPSGASLPTGNGLDGGRYHGWFRVPRA